MKRVLIGDKREALLSTLEVMLKHWGYRVIVSSRADQVKAFLEQTSPDLLIIGAGMLASTSSLMEGINSRIDSAPMPLVVLGEEDSEVKIGIDCETLGVPIDLFALFEVIQRHLEKHPRKNLRLTVKLPSLFSSGETSCLAEVMSISTRGMFVKTAVRMGNRDPVRVVIPLLGMQRELEVCGRVLYCVLPGPENNYLQGVGIEFTDLDEQTQDTLEGFIEKRFLGELSESRDGGHLNREQLRDAHPPRR
ncbi:hypothetical protein DESUT3_14630 [Desulfuromonas versatilis]|uniref:Response regulatory domain-containing protein n=1 Tax=Desulfuromonas versatilis TaxID=2802975 RepID=A0ABN6DWZ8_9BACT|nr:PilZ domain-containing protein [Desulfuromonas versatilis]BCR04394.1 hypothetical protein DESUT3_14630 [Desulfuromonas versatilis]